jgi:hypothetical protein
MDTNVRVHGEDNRIILDFDSLGEALQLWKPWCDGKRRTEITQLLHQALHGAGLCLEVRVQGRCVMTLGMAQASGLALQLLGKSGD